MKLKIEAFDSGIKPLIQHQRPYFSGHESSLMKALLNLRGSANGTPISHVADELLLHFMDLVDADLATNILLSYVQGYVGARNRYDETQGTSDVPVPGTSGVVLTLKGLAVILRKLSPAQVEMNLSRIGPLGITVLPHNPLPQNILPRFSLYVGLTFGRRCTTKTRKCEDRVLRCAYHFFLSWATRIKCLKR